MDIHNYFVISKIIWIMDIHNYLWISINRILNIYKYRIKSLSALHTSGPFCGSTQSRWFKERISLYDHYTEMGQFDLSRLPDLVGYSCHRTPWNLFYCYLKLIFFVQTNYLISVKHLLVVLVLSVVVML